LAADIADAVILLLKGEWQVLETGYGDSIELDWIRIRKGDGTHAMG
jgi:hypothetical protein